MNQPLNTDAKVVIVGGSLTGLACALSLAHQGVPSLVLERVAAPNRSGGGLGVNRAILHQVTGLDPKRPTAVSPLPVVQSYRESTSWLALHDWLQENALRQSLIELHEGVDVASAGCDQDRAWVQTHDGRRFSGSIVVGCDGYKSVVRKEINPAVPNARYAGYMLWRGLVNEREMSADSVWAGKDDSFGFIDRSGYRADRKWGIFFNSQQNFTH